MRRAATSFNLRLQVLTPVHVWSGRELIVGVDLVRKEGNLYCAVDLERVPPELAEEIAKRMATSRAEDIARVLSNYAGNLPCRYISVARYQPKRNERVKDISEQLIPGSTLKGYIRTAVMRSILKSMNPQQVRSLLAGVDLEDVRNAAQPIEGALFRTPRLRRQGGFVDAFQSLLISDPLEKSDTELSIIQVTALNIESGSSVAQIPVVALSSGKLKYRVDLRSMAHVKESAAPVNGAVAEHLHKIVDKLSMLSKYDLLSSLKDFGCSIIDEELKRLSRCGRQVACDAYRELLEELRSRYCGESGSCVAAKLGFATGYHAKTVLPLIGAWDPGFYSTVKSVMSRRLKRPWDEMTLKMAKLNGKLLGVGWCELCPA
jgi:CRISPR type III-A-associated RAMP protein Csm5